MNASILRFLGAVAIIAVTLPTSADANAPAGRYTTASGTVYDTKTRLTWQQAVPSSTYTWAGAKTYCAGVGASLPGTGWRLPTMKELLTIVDYSRINPSIDPTAFPATPASYFWSSSPYAGSSTYGWIVHFGSGITSCFGYVVSSTYNVRCVR